MNKIINFADYNTGYKVPIKAIDNLDGTYSFSVSGITANPYIEVLDYASLPDPTTVLGETYTVKTATGTWALLNRKKAGFYRSNGTTWDYIGSRLQINDSADSLETLYSSSKIVTLLTDGSYDASFNTVNGREVAVDGAKLDTLNGEAHGVANSANTPILTINTDPTKFDSIDFTCYINGTKYTYPAETLSAGFNLGDDFVIVYVDGTPGLKLLSKDTFLTPTDLQDKLEIGGMATADGTNIIVIGNSHFDGNAFIRNLYVWSKFGKKTNFLGTAGSISENLTPLQIDVASGSIIDPDLNKEDIIGETSIGMVAYYHVTGLWELQAKVTPFIVDNLQFDNGTDLTAISNNKWVSHTIARSSRTGTYYFIYSQAEYLSEGAAIDAPPTVGGFGDELGNEVEPLAKIIIQKSAANISQVIDVRNQTSSVVSASTSTMQTTYDRSTQPQVVIANGKPIEYRNSLGDVDTTIQKWTSNDGISEYFSVNKNGVTVSGTASNVKFLITSDTSTNDSRIQMTNDVNKSFILRSNGSATAGSFLTNIANSVALQTNAPSGLYIVANDAAGEIIFATGGLGLTDGKAKINSNGNLLVGTTVELPNATADHKLQVDGYQLHKYGWKDLIAEFIPARGGAVNEPSWEDIGNGIVMSRWTNGEELPVAYHVLHDYAVETDAYPHIHFFSDDTESAGATVTWRFAYVIAKGHQQGQSLTVATTNIDMTYTYTGSEVAGEHIVLECSDAQAFDLIEPDTVILAQVTMLNETISGKVFGIQADLHYQSDREVTLNKAPDFNV